MKKGIIIIFCIFSLIFPQSFKHRNFRFNWKKSLVGSFIKAEQFKKYEAVILFEKVEIDLKEREIFRHQVIQFDTQEAIDKFNYFRVPITTNPYQELITNGIGNLPDTLKFPKALYDQIQAFDARIIRENKFEIAILKEEVSNRYDFRNDVYQPLYVHSFYVRNLQPGDQLEIVTKHKLPYNAYSYVFNEKLPKQFSKISIKNLPYGWLINKSANLDTTIQSIKTTQAKYGAINIELELKPLLPIDPQINIDYNEVNKINIIQYQYVKNLATLTSKDEFDTISWKFVIYALTKSNYPTDLKEIEKFDLNSTKITEYFEKLIKDNHLDKKSDIIKLIHDIYIQKYLYENDEAVYKRLEAVDESIYRYMKDNKFRKYYTDLYYFHFLERLGLPYYKVIVYDSRNYILDSNLVNIETSPTKIYAYENESGELNYFIPKHSKGGYYMNELPFYLQNACYYLIPQNLPRVEYDLGFKKQKLKILYPKTNNEKDNYRKQILHIKLNDENQSISYQYDAEFSGQYATLLRDYLKHNEINSNIHFSYFSNFLAENNIQPNFKTENTVYPFLFNLENKGELPSKVFENSDKNKIIDLSNFINSPYQDIDTHYFHANYRHDFLGTDSYKLIIESNQDFEILNKKDFEIFVSTESFMISSTLIELQKNKWEWNLIIRILDTKTSQKNLRDLNYFFQKIKIFRNSIFKIKST